MVEHKRIACITCGSGDIERVREQRSPLVIGAEIVRWYRRKCRACGQQFVTKERHQA